MYKVRERGGTGRMAYWKTSVIDKDNREILCVDGYPVHYNQDKAEKIAQLIVDTLNKENV